jgi:hypothetical protein
MEKGTEPRSDPNFALHHIAACWRFGMNPKGHGWAARGTLGRSALRYSVDH